VPSINDLVPLALFVALVLAVSLYLLAVSGHFPRRQGQRAFASTFGAVILFCSIVLVIACLAAGIAGALHFVPWYAAIIGGGFALLAAPLVLRCFPDRLVDGRGGPLAFAGISAALGLLLIWLAVSHRCAGPEARNWRPGDQTADLLRRGTCR
jgi:MFS family permease